MGWWDLEGGDRLDHRHFGLRWLFSGFLERSNHPFLRNRGSLDLGKERR